MSAITTHVLDTASGSPAQGIRITLLKGSGGSQANWLSLAAGVTNKDGRISDLLTSSYALEAGDYRLVFDTSTYFEAQNKESFYPSISIDFRVQDGTQHYHVPLLLSPFGYSTYRGS